MPNTLDTELARIYDQQGYLLVEGLFSAADVQRINGAIDEILATPELSSVAELEPGDRESVRRIWSPTKRHPLFADVAADPRLLDIIEQLIGPNILFHYSKLHMKAARVGSVVEWHQDFSYYPHTNTDLLSAMIYLDDATAENACLHVLPGSHKSGLANHYVDGYFRGKLTGANAPHPSEAVPLEAPAGSVAFVHCLLLHYSPSNYSDKRRRAFLPTYRAADAYPIYFGPHASHNEPGIKLLRGRRSEYARAEQANWLLPLAQREFGSLFELQEGSHLAAAATTSGYATPGAYTGTATGESGEKGRDAAVVAHGPVDR
jgi:ectoine hydroxylase-related dioxygenase (phytanoyl-CoA dioxygenase family)